MTKREMIESLLKAHIGAVSTLEEHQRRLQRMTTAALKRELLMRGLVDYDEPDDSVGEDDPEGESIPAAFLGIVRASLYVE